MKNLYLLLFFLIACQKNSETPIVETTTVSPEHIDNYKILFSFKAERRMIGYVEATNSGVVDLLSIRQGDTITQGDTLLEFENSIEKNEYRSAYIEFEYARKELDRSSELFKKSARSSVELERARFEFDKKKNALSLKKIELQKCIQTANHSGVIDSLYCSADKSVNVGDTLYRYHIGEWGFYVPSTLKGDTLELVRVIVPSKDPSETPVDQYGFVTLSNEVSITSGVASITVLDTSLYRIPRSIIPDEFSLNSFVQCIGPDHKTEIAQIIWRDAGTVVLKGNLKTLTAGIESVAMIGSLD